MAADFDPHYEWLGIRPDEHPVDHYRLLGIPAREDDATRISAAADQRITYLRSLRAGPRGEFAQQLLKAVSAARRCLLDPAAKAAYDAALPPTASAPAAQVAARPAPAFPGRPAPLPPQPPKTLASNSSVRPQAAAAPTAPSGPPTAVPASPRAAAAPPVPPPSTALQGPTAETAASQEHPPPVEVDPDERALFKLLAPAVLLAAFALIVTAVWAVGTWLKRHGKAKVAASAGDGKGRDSKRQPTAHGSAAQPTPSRGAVQAVQQADGRLALEPRWATLHGDNLRLTDRGGAAAIGNWSSLKDFPSWRCRVQKPGVFRVRIEYQTQSAESPGVAAFQLAGQRKRITLRGGTGMLAESFFLAIRRRGDHTAELKALELTGKKFIRLQRIELMPRGLK